MNGQEYEPRIIGFLCSWCSYSGADAAGVQREVYPSNMRPITVPCSGSVDPVMIFEALERGADGVLLVGCPMGGCHYHTGNYLAKARVSAIRQILSEAGLNPGRVEISWIGASDGKKYARLIGRFTSSIARMGRIGTEMVESSDGLKENLEAARFVANSERLRWLIGRGRDLEEKGDAFGEKSKRIESVISECIKEEFLKSRILIAARDGGRSCNQIAEMLGEPADRVLASLIQLEKEGQIRQSGEKDRAPTYEAALS
jgi:coenzyme F420-reducing hydrogenase delta subunit